MGEKRCTPVKVIRKPMTSASKYTLSMYVFDLSHSMRITQAILSREIRFLRYPQRYRLVSDTGHGSAYMALRAHIIGGDIPPSPHLRIYSSYGPTERLSAMSACVQICMLPLDGPQGESGQEYEQPSSRGSARVSPYLRN